MDIAGSIFLTNTEIYKLVLPINWSLTYELYFYLLFTLRFATRLNAVKIIMHIILFLMFLRIIFIWVDSGLAYFFASHFLVEFFAGVVLYIHRERLNNPWIAVIFALVAIISFAHGVQINALNNVVRIFTFGVSAISIIAVAITLENCKIYLANKIFIRIGDASYTIYLSHLLFLNIFYFSGLRTFLSTENWIIAEAGFFAYIFGIVWSSIIIYKKFEFPFYNFISKKIT